MSSEIQEGNSVASELSDSKHSPNLMLEISFLNVIFICYSYSHICKICHIFERCICCVAKIFLHSFLERASRSALAKYTIKSLVYVSTTKIFGLYNVGYMFRPVNRSSSGHQSNKSKVLLTL